jgi:hypothetical protein
VFARRSSMRIGPNVGRCRHHCGKAIGHGRLRRACDRAPLGSDSEITDHPAPFNFMPRSPRRAHRWCASMTFIDGASYSTASRDGGCARQQDEESDQSLSSSHRMRSICRKHSPCRSGIGEEARRAFHQAFWNIILFTRILRFDIKNMF